MIKPAKKSETTVTRIKADASSPATKTKTDAPVKQKDDAKKTTKVRDNDNPFVNMGRYFKGAWTELRQVRWPDRKNTWAMTGALLAFTLFFIIVILFLDFLFSELFKLILGSN